MKKALAMALIILTAAGFEWSFARSGEDVILVEFKNRTDVPLDFFVNGEFVCAAAAKSSAIGKITFAKGSYVFEAWFDGRTTLVGRRNLESLESGAELIWEIDERGRDKIRPAGGGAPSSQRKEPPHSPAANASYLSSGTWLSFQGSGIQNEARMTSFAKIERQLQPAETTYRFYGQSGFRIGPQDDSDVYAESAPMTIRRDASRDLLSSDNKGLNLWLSVANGILDHLVHKRVPSGNWEEILSLPFDASFPKMIPVRFQLRRLPKPDDQWVVITADGALLSFDALDAPERDPRIYGRYRGVLVYSPEKDSFLQTAAAFTLYRGEEKLRIEQLSYAADAEGNPLHPLLDVAPYLLFKSEEPQISNPAIFPRWCIQAVRVFDIVDLAVMTAAEGSVNPAVVWKTVGQSLMKAVWQTGGDLADCQDLILKAKLQNVYLQAWLQGLEFYATRQEFGTFKAIQNLLENFGTSTAWAIAPDIAGMIWPPARIILKFAIPATFLAIHAWNTYKLQKVMEDTEPAPEPQMARVPTIPPQVQPGIIVPPPVKKKPGAGSTVLKIIGGIGLGIIAGVAISKLINGKKSNSGNGTETWTGNFQMEDIYKIYGDPITATTTIGTMSLSLTRNGSAITGTNTIANLEDTCVLLDPIFSCIPVIHSPSLIGNVAGSVNTDGSYSFTTFILDGHNFAPFTATVRNGTMTAKNMFYSYSSGPSGDDYTAEFTVYKK